MDMPILQRRWKSATALLIGFATCAAQAIEPPLRAPQHYSIHGSLDEVRSSTTAAPTALTPTVAAPSAASMTRDGYTLAAHLIETPLACAGDEIFANGFD